MGSGGCSSDDDDDLLPPPSALFSLLATPKPGRSTRQLSSSSSTTPARATSKTARALAGTGSTDAQARGNKAGGAEGRVKAKINLEEEEERTRRSSPRLKAQQQQRDRRDRTPEEEQAEEQEQERAKHGDLAALLFPPSPPPATSSSASAFLPSHSARAHKELRENREEREGSLSVVSDSEDERQRGWRAEREVRRRERARRRKEGEKEQGGREEEGELGAGQERKRQGEKRPLTPSSSSRTPRPRDRKPRSSIIYSLSSSASSSSSSSSSSSDEDENEVEKKWALPTVTPRASTSGKLREGVVKKKEGEGEGEEADFVADSLGGLSLDGSSPSFSTARTTPSAAPPNPDLDNPSHPFPPSSSSAKPPPSLPPSTAKKSQRLKRRITISVISSSSSSSASESEVEDSCPPPAKARSKVKGKKGVELEENEEILAACTDDEVEVDMRGGGAGGGEDLQEFDGVYVYNPTPKKRPVKLSSLSCDSPFSSPAPPTRTPSLAGKRTPARKQEVKPTGKSRLGREIDLTESGSSGSEDELPPPSRIFPSSSTSAPKTTPRPRPHLPPASASTSTPRPRPPPAAKTKPASTAKKAVSAKPATLSPSDRSSLPLSLIRELDRLVFKRRWEGMRCLDREGEVGRGKGLPSEIEIVWSNRLRNTAGRASWKTTKHSSPSKPHLPPRITHFAQIELATKVVDTPEKLKHTLAHELCHLAAWAIDGEMKPPHGGAFKMWANRIMLLRPDISVTTTHSYDIVYKYRWKCVSGVCGKIYGRHSNSINPQTHGCNCGARLVAIDKEGKPKGGVGAGLTGATGEGAGGGVETPRKKSKWQEFMATESPILRASNPSLPQSEILKLVAERWKVVKAAAVSSVVVDETGTIGGAKVRKGRKVDAGEQEEELEVRLGGLSL